MSEPKLHIHKYNGIEYAYTIENHKVGSTTAISYQGVINGIHTYVRESGMVFVGTEFVGVGRDLDDAFNMAIDIATLKSQERGI